MPYKAKLTDLNLGTTTVTTEVATTSVAILSGKIFMMNLKKSNVLLIHLETTTFISLVGATTTEVRPLPTPYARAEISSTAFLLLAQTQLARSRISQFPLFFSAQLT
jgi:hypothetical protein